MTSLVRRELNAWFLIVESRGPLGAVEDEKRQDPIIACI